MGSQTISTNPNSNYTHQIKYNDMLEQTAIIRGLIMWGIIFLYIRHAKGSGQNTTPNKVLVEYHLPSSSTGRKGLIYSLFQKKRTFYFKFFCGPHGEGGPKIHLHNRSCEFLVPLPQGGHEKKSELNVRFFWNRLY